LGRDIKQKKTAISERGLELRKKDDWKARQAKLYYPVPAKSKGGKSSGENNYTRVISGREFL